VTAPGTDWVEQARRFAAGLAAEHSGAGLSDVLGNLLGSGVRDAGTEHGTDCRWCPLCTGLAALRGRRPDLLEALADVLTGAATALRTSAGTTPSSNDAATDDPAPEPTAPPEETVPHPATAPVQRIDVA
jgi:hypothetical protein